jgi:hypothetical protein
MPWKIVLQPQKKNTVLEKSKTVFRGIKSNPKRILWAQVEELMKELWSLW